MSDNSEIILGVGANLPSFAGSPRQTAAAAIEMLKEKAIFVQKCSSFWKSAPVPISDQPWYINAVVSVKTEMSPEALLGALHEIERTFKRERGEVNQARTLDLDLLAYKRQIIKTDDLIVPHPRMSERAFVLLPLAEILPDWIHPLSGVSVQTLIKRMPDGQQAAPD